MLDIIILTKTSSIEHRDMTERCVRSYLTDGDTFIRSIILMESDRDFDSSYWLSISDKIKTIKPSYKFNYNIFLNIALEHCTSDYICISNNDVVVKPSCIKMMLAVFTKIPTLMSASPVDRTWHLNSYTDFPEDNKVYVGYQTSKFLLGFCIFARKQVFDIIGKFDERFHFYHQDNDYEQCLRKNNLQHALVTFSHIEHGNDKPESNESGDVVRSRLLASQQVYHDKWLSQTYKESFVRYRRLSIITTTPTIPLNDLVEVVDDISKVTGRYSLTSSSIVSNEQQHRLLDILCYVPDSLSIEGYNLVKNF